MVLSSVILLASSGTFADEGQWQPYQMPSIADKLNERGINIPAKQLADLTQYPMNAVVGLGYCTASFVSPQGLVITNHHCAYNAIQYNSKKEHNYIANGFLASSKDQEPSAGPNERLYITEAVTDVSAQIIDKLSLLPLIRYQEIQSKRKSLIKVCENDKNYRCSVRSFHNGLEYYLIKQLIIRDVRLVYAPPKSVGAFGGDIDNYEYPRHSGDFTFLRAYIGKDGKPAAYSTDNVPFTPKSYLKINADGIKIGDGVFVAGYPGLTSRYRLTSELQFANDWLYPTLAARYQLRINTIKKIADTDDNVAIKYAGTLASMANRMKKYQGLLDGFKATDIIGIKQNRQDDFLKWLAADKMYQGYQSQFDQLETLLNKKRIAMQTRHYFEHAQSSALLDAANKLYRLSQEKHKPDSEREEGYQERDIALFTARLKRIDSRFDRSVDKTLWQQDLQAYVKQEHRVAALDTMLNNPDKSITISDKLDGLYALTSLTNQEKRLAWMTADSSQFETSTDPFIRLAVALYDTNMAQEKEKKTLLGELSQARPDYMKAIIAYNKAKDRPIYPDANGTLRISYGKVEGYQSRDALYKQPFTRLEGIIAKHTGVAPFNAPNKILDAIKKQDYGSHKVASIMAEPSNWICQLFSCSDKPEEFNSVPVNFLSSVDTTGGNSGSPVFNGKGELVGLNFDSTYEAITKDWFFNPTITRAIHVDIRYILWMMDKVDHANNLIEELELVRN
ncbi:S46 family peptidase [Shewanella sp. VB17]|uniref:S46 family peptidase n=1 Tax=Shewanella sp. VB17 TaxID=2739432 RepID=UPI0020B86A97|nr:S46 family peptidase [Shewanella sp. VB17]